MKFTIKLILAIISLAIIYTAAGWYWTTISAMPYELADQITTTTVWMLGLIGITTIVFIANENKRDN